MMYTYIIESQGLYKIGKAININKRMRAYRTHNPQFRLIKSIEGDYEAKLHYLFKEKRIIGEWFELEEADIDSIDVTKLNDIDIESGKCVGRLIETDPHIHIIHSAKVRDQLMNMSSGSRAMIVYIIYNMSTETQEITITPKEYAKKTGNKSLNTYKKAVQELVSKGFLTLSLYKYVYWINPSKMFSGSRITKYPENVLITNGFTGKKDENKYKVNYKS